MSWKGDIRDMPMDWWEGKVAYYKYKELNKTASLKTTDLR